MFFRKQRGPVPLVITIPADASIPGCDEAAENKVTSYRLEDLIDCLENNAGNLTINELREMLRVIQENQPSLLVSFIKRNAFQAAHFLMEEGETTTNELSEGLLALCANHKKDLPLAWLLLNGTSDPNIKDVKGQTALHACYATGAPLSFLSQVALYANVNLCNVEGDMVLHQALRAGDHRTVEMLLQNGGDPNRLDGQGQLPLVVAAHLSQGDKCLVTLLRNGAQVEATDSRGRTALALVQNPAASMLLMEHGARSDIPDANGVTPLHTALSRWTQWRSGDSLALVLFRKKAVAELLVNQAQSVNLTDKQGATPLHYACKVRDRVAAEFVRLLVENGAVLGVRDCQGRTPLEVAKVYGNDKTAAVLVELGAESGETNSNGLKGTRSVCDTQKKHGSTAPDATLVGMVGVGLKQQSRPNIRRGFKPAFTALPPAQLTDILDTAIEELF